MRHALTILLVLLTIVGCRRGDERPTPTATPRPAAGAATALAATPGVPAAVQTAAAGAAATVAAQAPPALTAAARAAGTVVPGAGTAVAGAVPKVGTAVAGAATAVVPQAATAVAGAVNTAVPQAATAVAAASTALPSIPPVGAVIPTPGPGGLSISSQTYQDAELGFELVLPEEFSPQPNVRVRNIVGADLVFATSNTTAPVSRSVEIVVAPLPVEGIKASDLHPAVVQNLAVASAGTATPRQLNGLDAVQSNVTERMAAGEACAQRVTRVVTTVTRQRAYTLLLRRTAPPTQGGCDAAEDPILDAVLNGFKPLNQP